MDNQRNRFLLLFCILAGMFLTAGVKQHAELTPHEEEIARRIGFSREVMVLVKDETSEQYLHRLSGYDEDGYQIMVNGISVAVGQDRAESLLAALRQKLRPLKYMAFIVEMNAGIKVDTLGILKGVDQYDILRVMQTSSEDDDLATDDVIAKLKEWEKCWAFDIIGAGIDWIEIEFRKLPPNLKTFAADVQEFAPGSVDDSALGLDELAEELRKTKRLFLVWE